MTSKKSKSKSSSQNQTNLSNLIAQETVFIGDLNEDLDIEKISKMPTAELIKEYYDNASSPTYSYFSNSSFDLSELDERDCVDEMEFFLFKQNTPERTYMSKPTYSFDVPEIKSLRGRFIYNYFTPDERVNANPDTVNPSVDNNEPNYEYIQYMVYTQQSPRLIELEFEPANDPFATINTSNVQLISDDISKIVAEGSVSSKYYTGFELIDTGAESIYTYLNQSSLIQQSISSDGSPAEAAAQINELTLPRPEGAGSSSVTGFSKRYLIEALKNVQSDGNRAAGSDAVAESESFDSVTRQSISMRMNNLFFHDIIRSSTRIIDNTFQDEIRSIASISSEVQDSFSQQSYEAGFNYLNGLDYEPVVAPYEAAVTDPASGNSEIVAMGYIVDKYEIDASGTATFVEKLFVNSGQATKIVDTKIKYGATYTYRIRSLFKVITSAALLSDPNEAEEDYGFVSFLIASEGEIATISCVENIPPPAPQNINVRLDYKNRIPYVSWQFPFNKQRDIKRFQIFRRNSVEEPFVLIAEYDFDDSEVKSNFLEVAQSSKLYKMNYPMLSYLDVGYVRGTSPIYTVACVDAHGLTSNYGPQIQATLDKFRNRIVQKVVSGPGAPKPYPNLYLREDAFSDAAKCSGYDRMHVFFDPDYARVTKYMRDFGNESYETIASFIAEHQDVSVANPLVETDLNVIAVDPNFETYQIHIVNADLQKDEVVKIKLADKSGAPTSFEVSNLSTNNLSFEFGVPV